MKIKNINPIVGKCIKFYDLQKTENITPEDKATIINLLKFRKWMCKFNHFSQKVSLGGVVKVILYDIIILRSPSD